MLICSECKKREGMRETLRAEKAALESRLAAAEDVVKAVNSFRGRKPTVEVLLDYGKRVDDALARHAEATMEAVNKEKVK